MQDASTGPPIPARRIFDWLVAVAFAAGLLAPSLDGLLRSDAARGPAPEKRAAASKPAWPQSAAGWLEWPRRYEAWWNDCFGLRDVLLRWHAIVRVFLCHASPDGKHVLGRDNWIFNTNDGLIDTWRGIAPFDERTLDAWIRRLEARRDALRQLGAHHLFAIAPDKAAIYPEFLPPRLTKVGPSRLDQLLGRVRGRSDLDVIDLRPALLAAKAGDRPGDHVYFELGTHWQRRGAVAAFDAVVEHLRPRFPTLRPSSLLQLAATGEGLVDSEAEGMYIGDLMPAAAHGLRPGAPLRHTVVRTIAVPAVHWTEVPDPALPRVMIFRDSFGAAWETEWSETCSRLVTISSNDFDPDLVARERPALVIELFCERALTYVDPERPAAGERARVGFHEAPQLLARLDPARPAATLQPLQRAAATPGSDGAGPFVDLLMLDRLDAFWVRTERAGRGPVYVRLVLEAAAAGPVALSWKTADEHAWSPARQLTATAYPGDNLLFFAIPAGAAPLDGLALRPLSEPGRCHLRELEVRGAPPD